MNQKTDKEKDREKDWKKQLWTESWSVQRLTGNEKGYLSKKIQNVGLKMKML